MTGVRLARSMVLRMTVSGAVDVPRLNKRLDQLNQMSDRQ